MGGELRQAEDDTAIVTAESDRALALFAIRMSQYAAILLSAHRSVQEGTRRSMAGAVRENDDARRIYRPRNISWGFRLGTS